MVSEAFAKLHSQEWLVSEHPTENIWNIIDETTYKDPAPKTMKELKRRLRFAWKNVTLDTLKELAHSMPRRLENAIKNNGGHAGY